MDRLLSRTEIDKHGKRDSGRFYSHTPYLLQTLLQAQIQQDNEWIMKHKWARRNETGEIYYMIPESELTNVD